MVYKILNEWIGIWDEYIANEAIKFASERTFLLFCLSTSWIALSGSATATFFSFFLSTKLRPGRKIRKLTFQKSLGCYQRLFSRLVAVYFRVLFSPLRDRQRKVGSHRKVKTKESNRTECSLVFVSFGDSTWKILDERENNQVIELGSRLCDVSIQLTAFFSLTENKEQERKTMRSLIVLFFNFFIFDSIVFSMVFVWFHFLWSLSPCCENEIVRNCFDFGSNKSNWKWINAENVCT